MELASAWRFTKGDVAGAEAETFNDDGWQQVSVPHDWSIAGPFDKDNKSGGAGGIFARRRQLLRRHLGLAKSESGQAGSTSSSMASWRIARCG